ncbi:MAG: NAD(P)/FAD-dependent oxidoreductase [Deltaproteobacteria bacterium]|nr:NAD(P)/FAD-dependent oxidoreductase [Deltaproteobacteria bacterium]
MRHVIIGTSAAGLAAAEMVRRLAPGDAVALISDEPHLPYSRPLLTYLLGGEITPEKIWLRPRDYFERFGFEAHLGEPVVQVDPEGRAVHLASGRTVPYDRLLVASGANPRVPEIPGTDLGCVFTLRHLADWRRLEAELPAGGPVVVVGMGAVGLKAADAFRQRGYEVHVLARGAQALSKVLDPTAAGLLHDAVTALGIRVHYHAWPTALKGANGRVAQVVLNDGRELSAAAVLFSVGVEPRVDFLAGAGLAGPDGVPVDRTLRTGHPNIYAAGDCVLPHHLLTGKPAAFHIWPAAVAQGEVAGANMAGAGRVYDGILPMNSISLKTIRIITGGHQYPDGPHGEVFAHLDGRTGHYRRLVMDDGRLVGVTLVGDVAHAGIYFRIMARKLPLRDLPADPRTPDFQPGRLWA